MQIVQYPATALPADNGDHKGSVPLMKYGIPRAGMILGRG